MDSITQFTLGAAVGVAVGGRKLGPRKAALAGGLLGTIPDLDVFIPLGDPVADFIYHRGPTHSLFVHALVTPIFGEGLRRLFAGLRDHWRTAWAMVFLCFTTHAIIDWMTVYGTRILWPLPADAFALGTFFIIDPLYTIPLLILVIWALTRAAWSKAMAIGVTMALGLSTLYGGWSVLAQAKARSQAEAYLAEHNIAVDRMMVTPTPFNTFFWRAIAVTNEHYINVYVPLLGGEPQAYRHPRGGLSPECLPEIEQFALLHEFADGFVKTEIIDGQLWVRDLRMGSTPSYVFSFIVADRDNNGFRAIPPQQIRSSRETTANDWAWLQSGILGEPIVRNTEASTALALNSTLAPQTQASC